MRNDDLLPVPPTGHLAPGADFGPYRIIAGLGSIGAEKLWKARDPRLNRDVAIRISEHNFNSRAALELRALAALNHPNICAVYDTGPNYLVTELVEGDTLADRILKCPLPLHSALGIARYIALALQAAHAKGVVHRDLRPENIRILPDGTVKVMNFSLGTDEDAGTATQTLTATMGVAGALGQPRADKDLDIRAFGAVLYEMLTGRKPSEATGNEAAWDLAPAAARPLLRACLTEDPGQRLSDFGAIDWNNGAEPAVGVLTWGPFRLIERVGRGAFGEVYRAHDPKLDREVAVKLLQTPGDDDSDYRAILREARLIARVRHPNIVSVYGVERYEGRVGFWSDFVRGKTLENLFGVQGRFGAGEAASIGIEVCRALSAMHAAGLLHRDIKASNVMREQGGRILLMDFGLSSDVKGGGQAGGTPLYMAPELFRGGAPSVTTDIYATGVLLFFLTTGRYPLDSLKSLARRRLIDERPDLPEAFVRAVETAVDLDPARRFSSAGEMLAALSSVAGTSQKITLQPNKKPLPKLAQVLVAFALVLVLGGIGYQVFAPGNKAGLAGPARTGANQYYMAAEALVQREDKSGNVEKAIDLYGKAIAADPKFALAHGGLARAWVLRYGTTRSPEFLEKAAAEGQLALDADSSLAPVHVTMGIIYRVKSRYDLAANELQQALRLDSTNAEAFIQLAKLYTAQGRTSDVVPNYLKAIDLAPDDWRWPNQLAQYYNSVGKFAEAVEQYKRVISLTPDNKYGFQGLGISYRRLERFPEAEAAFSQALKLDPTSANTLNGYANLLMSEGKYAEATRIYGQLVELSPADYLMRGNLASAYQWSGMKDKARAEYLLVIEMAEKARKVQPRDPALLATLGGYYATIGNEARALPLLRQALALSPEDPNILVRAGEGFELTGHRSEAITLIGKALDLGYSARYVQGSPELAELRKDPKFLARPARMR